MALWFKFKYILTPILFTVGDYCCFNPFPYNRVHTTNLLKTPWEMEKLLVTSNFSFSHAVFYPFGEPAAIFIKLKIVDCQLWTSLKFVIWERVNPLPDDKF